MKRAENQMKLYLPSLSINESVARSAVAVFVAQLNPTIEEIRAYCQRELDSMWDEVLRFENPHNYYVDLSQRLWDEKHKLLRQGRK